MKLIELLNVIHPSQDIYVYWRGEQCRDNNLYIGLVKDFPKSKLLDSNIISVWNGLPPFIKIEVEKL